MLQFVMLMLAQDVVGPPGDEPVAVPGLTQQRRACRPAPGDDIVVCGLGAQSQRLEPLPEWSDEPAIKPAGARLSPNKTVTAHAEEGQNPYSSSPRAMITFKLDF